MTLAQTYSWLFYALALANGTEPAKHKDIEQVADGINHAIPTQKEMKESLTWLSSEGLIVQEGKAYLLSANGVALLNRLSNHMHTTTGIWASIEKHFEECGVDNVAEVNPKTLAT